MTKTKTKKSAADVEVTVDRRNAKGRRSSDDRRTKTEPVKVELRTMERREKVSRRRQIDPTTCERDYTNDEIEFMQALDVYKRTSGRMFPTCSEILEVVRDLGYAKLPPMPANESAETAAVASPIGNTFENVADADIDWDAKDE